MPRRPAASRVGIARRVAAICGLLVVAWPGAPTTTAQQAAQGGVIRAAARPLTGRYIVVLRGGDDPEAVAYQAAGMLRGGLRHVYRQAVHGFAMQMSETAAQMLSRDPRVEFVEEDGVITLAGVQVNPPSWGLDRIDERAPYAEDDRAYRYNADGTGVNAYVVDSGIRSTHQDFGGRVFGGFSAVPDGYGTEDCYGHGTHVAGILGGALHGVAKNVTLHSVRIFDCNGVASWSGLIAAMDWISTNHVKPAVANMSLSGVFSSAANEAVQGVIAAGVAVVVSAGNDNWDACNSSPASVADAIVVAASDSQDIRSALSNFGPCVDLFAPGVNITSAAVSSDTATAQMSGTSMSAPHVAGAVALYLQGAPSASPAQVEAALVGGATIGAIDGPGPGSPNRVLFTPFLGDRIAPRVSLVAPANGALVTGTVTLRATATDNVEVSKVLFFAGPTLLGTDTTAPYSISWNTTVLPDGTYALHAQAQDWAGNLRDSEVVSVTKCSVMADTVPPRIAFGRPASGAAVSGTVAIEATASDNTAVRQVAFYVGTKLVGADTSTPYSVEWDARLQANGVYTLRATASDAAGNTASATRQVIVANGALASPWTDVDVGIVGSAGGAAYANAAFSIVAGGQDLWSTADAFHFVHRTWTGDGDLVARVSDLTKASDASFSMAGLMFRESLAAGSRHAAVVIGSNGKVKFRRRATVGGTTASDGPPAGSTLPPKWLKLARRGSVFAAYMSDDGSRWTPVSSAQPLSLPGTVEVGLLALRSGGAHLAQAVFASVQLSAPVAEGWSTTDVGVVGTPGGTSIAAGTYTLSAAGTDLWGPADAFHIVYRSWTGDGQIVARVVNLTAPPGSAFALGAVMIRETLDDNAPHASLLVTSEGKTKFRRRLTVGGITSSDGPLTRTSPSPRWLKLTRRGNVFAGYTSTDGTTWQQIHTSQTIALGSTVYVGVVALRSGGTDLGTAVFTDVSVRSPGP